MYQGSIVNDKVPERVFEITKRRLLRMPEPKVFHTLSDHCVGEKCLMTKYAFMGNFFGEFHNQWLSSVVLINMKQSHFRQFFLLCLLQLQTALVLFLSSVQPSQKDLGSGPNGSGS